MANAWYKQGLTWWLIIDLIYILKVCQSFIGRILHQPWCPSGKDRHYIDKKNNALTHLHIRLSYVLNKLCLQIECLYLHVCDIYTIIVLSFHSLPVFNSLNAFSRLSIAVGTSSYWSALPANLQYFWALVKSWACSWTPVRWDQERNGWTEGKRSVDNYGTFITFSDSITHL